MFTILVALLLSGVTSEDANKDYKSAYKEALKAKKPLMVVVGADWCHACNVLKDSTIKPMVKTGQLDNVSIALVNKDLQPELVDQLTHGEKMIPQIIVFTKTDSGWKRSKLMGYQPQNNVRDLVNQAVSRTDTGTVLR